MCVCVCMCTPMFWSLLKMDSDKTRVFINMPVCAIYTHVCNFITVIFSVTGGTALQAGRSRVRFPIVSLDIFIDIILLAALWPWGRFSL